MNEFKQALNFDPNNSFIHEAIGNLCLELNNVKEAFKEYNKAIELNGKLANSILPKKIEILYKSKEYTKVVQDCDKVN